jgi:uncharacterized protein (TIGR02453 family)
MNLKKSYDFLCDLQINNDRDWFHKNDKLYKEAKKEFELFVEKLIVMTREFDSSIGLLAAKDCTFRIHRDVRFSGNKDPYKTNMGAYIVRGGKKSPFAGYYMHLEPEGSFIGGGIYMPEPQVLNALRNEVFENTDEFKKILNEKEFKKIFPEIYGEKLKTAPKGFPKDFEDIELLKFKHYSLSCRVADEFWFDDNAEEKVITLFKQQLKFNNYLNRAVENMTE